MSSTPLVTNIYNLDFYDRITNLIIGRMKYDGANSLLENISDFEFNSRVFAGTAINPEQGSIISPERTVKFFPQTNSIHVINTHLSSNVTSIKKIIRAVMPSNFITEPHWLVVYVTAETLVLPANELLSQSYFVSTPVSSSVDTTFYALLELLEKMRTEKYGEDTSHYIEEISVVIRREL